MQVIYQPAIPTDAHVNKRSETGQQVLFVRKEITLLNYKARRSKIKNPLQSARYRAQNISCSCPGVLRYIASSISRY
jgi:hypothetical protein